jgi:hypothetical protein
MPFAQLFLIVALFAASPLAAQTILLSVRESSGGVDLPAPQPASDGLQSGLFDKGFIVFDAPAGVPRPGTKELAAAARSSGAQAVLSVEVEYRDAPRGADLSQVSARASFSLVDAATGALMTKGVEEASNRQREAPLSRDELGREVGTRIAARVFTSFQ